MLWQAVRQISFLRFILLYILSKTEKKIGFEIYDGVNFEYLKIFGIFLGKPLKKLRTCLSGVFLCVV
jgi:hypothetical protein